MRFLSRLTNFTVAIYLYENRTKPMRMGNKEAIHKIDSFRDGLMKRDFPGGVVIKDPSKEWVGNRMNFSFKAKKGWIGATISGDILVTDNSVVVLISDLPALIKTFVSEEKIQKVIADQIDILLGQESR